MCRNPLYFFKSKHGVYQFRYSLPLSIFQKYKVQREIKISLRTKQRDIAIRRHYVVLAQVDSIIRTLERFIMINSTTKKQAIQDLLNKHKEKIKIDAIHDKNFELSIENLRLQVNKSAQQKKYEEIIREQSSIINALTSSKGSAPDKTPHKITIIEAIYQFFILQVERQRWSPKIKKQRKGYFRVFSDIVGGNQDISVLNQSEITQYQRTLRKLPKNVNKFHKRPTDTSERVEHYKNIALNNDKEVLSARGLESHFNTVKPFLSWCVEMGYLEKDHRHILAIGKREIQETKKDVLPFSHEQLVTMFTSYIYSDYRIPREKPKRMNFWMPLIGLYTGARESEIATLRVSDIKKHNGILCFDFNDDHKSKSLKTPASKRCVPIAQVVINAGFLEYVSQQEKESKEKDPNLFDFNDNEGAAARAVSRWFNDNFRDKCHLTTSGKTKVCYHSFRHTTINKLSSTKIGNNIVEK